MFQFFEIENKIENLPIWVIVMLAVLLFIAVLVISWVVTLIHKKRHNVID